MSDLSNKNSLNKTGFINKFVIPELKSIVSESYLQLVLLIIMTLIAMLALGLGQGAQSYLNNKISEPGIKFIDVDIPFHIEDFADGNLKDHESIFNDTSLFCFIGFDDNNPPVVKKHNTEKLINDRSNNICDSNSVYSWREKFDFEGPFKQFYDSQPFYIYDSKDNSYKSGKVAVVYQDDPFYSHLKSGKIEGVLSNKFDLVDGDLGVIVTENFLKQLNYDSHPTHIAWRNDSAEEDYMYVYFPVVGVVEQLRERVDVWMSAFSYSVLNNPEDYSNHSSLAYNSLRYFVSSIPLDNLNDFEDFEDSLKDYGFKLKPYDGALESGFLIDHPSPYTSKKNYEFLTDSIKNVNRNNKVEFIKKLNDSLNLDIIKLINFDQVKYKKINKDTDALTFLLNDLEKAEEFNEYLESYFKTGLNTTVIENKKNFSFFNKLIKSLTRVLQALGVFTIVFIIISLISSHLEKNKQNLGTLKAFGLSNRHIIMTYSFISLAIAFCCVTISYLLSSLIGPMVLDLVIIIENAQNTYFEEVNYENYSKFSSFAWFVIVPCIIIVMQLYFNLNKVTPGDLIYKRK